MAIRVLVVDDHEVVRIGLCTVLRNQADFEVVGEAATGNEALVKVANCQPDVVVLDVRLPDTSGIEVCREIVARFPQTRILMLTTYGEDEAIYASILAGASGFILKDINVASFVEAIRAVSQGKCLLDQTVTAKLLQRLRGEALDNLEETLTPREHEILLIMADGKNNREIAERLFLCDSTVKNHVSSILNKLSLSSRSQAVAYCYQHEIKH